MPIQPAQFMNDSLGHFPGGDGICRILAAVINSADAGVAIKKNVHLDGHYLVIQNKPYDLDIYKRLFIIAVGKAALPMAASISKILGNHLTSGLVITKKGYLTPEDRVGNPLLKIIEANHPIPTEINLDASRSFDALFVGLKADDLVICLLSGGGSALLTKSSPGISLKDLQVVTHSLLACGAEIGEINTIRKHLDEFKGGKLARVLFPARIVTVILSDVIGDRLDQICSGPTVADPTTFADAWSIFNKYQLIESIPSSIREHLQAGIEGKRSETLKAGDPLLESIDHLIIGSNSQTVFAAEQVVQEAGFTAVLLGNPFAGEASHTGAALAERAKSEFTSVKTARRPTCLIAGGETTVHTHGKGMGGRNQELALGAVKPLSGEIPMILVSLATDGDDGPTDAAGAVVTHQTYQRGLLQGLNPQDFLANNDSYHYFERQGDLIKTGPTLTNVNDLVFIFTD